MDVGSSPRVDRVLAFSIASALGPPLVLATSVSCAAVAAALFMLRASLRRREIVALFAVAVLGAIRSELSLDAADRAHLLAEARFAPPERCLLVGTVVRSPVVRDSLGGSRDAVGRASIDLQVEAGDCNGVQSPRLTVRLHGAPEDLGRGDRVELIAELGATERFDNPGLRDPRLTHALTSVVASGRVLEVERIVRTNGISRSVDAARAHVRRRIEATVASDAVPLARALVLGETDLDPTDAAAFQSSGLSHLLAVSGSHLVVAVGTMIAALTWCMRRVPRLAGRGDVTRLVAVMAIPLTALYADFAGGSGSATRAAAMLVATLLTRALGRRPRPMRSFAFALGAHSIVQPLSLADVSFCLSLLATTALLALATRAERERSMQPLPRLLMAVLGTVAATVATIPVVLSIGGGLPVYSVAANLIAAPVAEFVALPAALLHATSSFLPPLEGLLATLVAGSLRAVRAIALAAAHAPGSTYPLPPPSDEELAIAAVVVVACWRWRHRIGLLVLVGLFALTLAEWQVARRGCPVGVLQVTALDVGQGDAILVDLPDGRGMLVDGGGIVGSPIDVGRRVVAPVLAARRRSRLDVVVLTHRHPDHYLGLASLLDSVEVGEFWDSGFEAGGDASPTLEALLEELRSRGLPVRSPADLCGTRHAFGSGRIEVLGPCPAPDPLGETNDSSLVLRVRLGSKSVLLMGDAEKDLEERLVDTFAEDGVARAEGLDADLLKVGHHGSRTSSTSRFLDAVAPREAFISCGIRNRFGHPAAQTRSSLEARGARIHRTDRDGALTWSTDGVVSEVRTQRLVRRASEVLSRYGALVAVAESALRRVLRTQEPACVATRFESWSASGCN